MDKMKVYISGQITGLNIKVAEGYFEVVENKLSDAGHAPINPCKILPYDPKFTWKEYMIEDIKAIFDCEAMFMLDNWRESKGAQIEHMLAQHLGLKVFYSTHHNLF